MIVRPDGSTYFVHTTSTVSQQVETQEDHSETHSETNSSNQNTFNSDNDTSQAEGEETEL